MATVWRGGSGVNWGLARLPGDPQCQRECLGQHFALDPPPPHPVPATPVASTAGWQILLLSATERNLREGTPTKRQHGRGRQRDVPCCRRQWVMTLELWVKLLPQSGQT